MASPDIPGYCSYLLVLLIGIVVARATVNSLMPNVPNRWGFRETWVLFAAHSSIPVLLFWFLDFVGAIHDTALFAALLVGFGYREIMTGGVNTVTMPAETSRLWQPFEKWVTRVAAKLNIRYKARRDVIEDKLREQIAADSDRLKRLLVHTLEHTRNVDSIKQEVDKIRAEPVPDEASAEEFKGSQNRRIARALLRELQAQQPDAYGKLLLNWGIVNRREYLWSIQDRSLTFWPWMGTALLFGLLVTGVWTFHTSERAKLRYHAWRFMKPSATAADRFRSRDYFIRQLALSGQQSLVADLQSTVQAFIARLEFKELTMDMVDEILRLVIIGRSKGLNSVSIPRLTVSLRTENSDIRARIAQTLLDLHDLDYPKSALPDGLREWKPSAKEPTLDTSTKCAQWDAWWRSVQ